MNPHRTCSFAGSIAAVSWRLACPEAAEVTAEVEVVAIPIEQGGRVVANLTVRLRAGTGWARGHVSIDQRHYSSFKVSPGETSLRSSFGHLFRDVVVLPHDVVDGQRHVITVVFEELAGDPDETQPGRRPFAADDRKPELRHETAFYARRVTLMRASARISVPAA